MLRLKKARISIFLSCLLILYSAGFAARLCAEDSSYLDSALTEARDKALYQDRYWQILLHYNKGFFGTRSLIDDPKFFLAKDGKYNAASELEATIRGIFTNEVRDGKPVACKFVARYAWIKEKLRLDESRIPAPECSNYNEPIKSFDSLLDEMKPESVTLVFPDAHINSPASMFGHTLLVIETESKSKLLAYAVNYAAFTQETFGPLYAVKGLFGFYKGYFSMLPYYGKLQEYGDIDRRDIWEYPLNLTRDETKQLLMHLYELDNIYAYYYFFDENCSYDLLFLLEAARPSLHLTDQQRFWVIPLDTIKDAQKKGIVLGAEFRPSQTTKIEYLGSLMTRDEKMTAIRMARGQLPPDEGLKQDVPQPEKKILTYDLSIDYLQYLRTRKEIPTETYIERFLKILQTRSNLGAQDSQQYRVPVPPRPDQGHDPSRIGFAAGSKGGSPFQELSYRPVYHSLLDDGKGYREGAQIIFGETSVRYYSQENKFKLEGLDVINIVSLAPRDMLFQPISWMVDTGLTQRIMNDGKDHMIAHLTPAGGFSWKNDILGLYYFMVQSSFTAGGAIPDNYAIGAGASAGLLRKINDSWRVHLYAKNIYYGLGSEYNFFEAGLMQSVILSTNSTISLGLTRSRSYSFYQTELKCGINVYF
ncbi:MAG TPA: DUF4105 domain-containing protein [Syntrophorhabdales bacterium]|nr:DUF4105 domain-containing protein [Syntrophorhabdales bacterium]